MSKKATSALLADHKMIRKLLGEFDIGNPRYDSISKTLKRVVLSHAWFEDQVFLPAFKKEPLFLRQYLSEIENEHHDIDASLKLVLSTNRQSPIELDAYTKQFRAILENHLQKEEDALFPLAEKILDNEGLNSLGLEMERRQGEAQRLFNS